jgi:hypothetical protein
MDRNMYWQFEIPVIVRSIIGDFTDPPTYSDDRINQIAIVASQYIVSEITLNKQYIVDIRNSSITPDPSDPASRDSDFISFWGLKTACMMDQSSLRTRALSAGIRTSLGSAVLDIDPNMDGYKLLLENGPCKVYDKLRLEYNIGNSSILQAVLSPFVGNNFDPQMLNTGRSDYRSIDKTIT